METIPVFLAAVALLAVVAIPSVIMVARLFKSSQQCETENGHDRAERREFDWYWKSDPEKKSATLQTGAHEISN
jgi:hypothetical protein